MSSLETLYYDFPEKQKWDAYFPYKTDEMFAYRLNELFIRGELPQKTVKLVPHAFCIDYKTGILREILHLCVYDPAGESFALIRSSVKENPLREAGYYDFISGLVFIVDPFSLPTLRKRYQRYLEEGGDVFDVSDLDPTDCLERLIHRLEENETLKRLLPEGDREDEEKVNKAVADLLKELPCAIVITKADKILTTKTDSFDLDKYIGEKGVRNFREKHPQYNEEEAMDIVCRYWLNKWGGHNILGVLGNKFGQTRCFAVSALGKSDSYGYYPYGFHPFNMDAPFNWILNISGRPGLNKWGVLLFLFGAVLAISAILSCAYHFAKIGVNDSPATSVVIVETQEKSDVRTQLRSLYYEVYERSAKSTGFDRYSIIPVMSAANKAMQVADSNGLDSIPTLEFVVEWRRFRDRYSQWREDNRSAAKEYDSRVRKAYLTVCLLEETAQDALFAFLVDGTIADEATRNQRNKIRDVVFDKCMINSGIVDFHKDVVLECVKEAAVISKLTSESSDVDAARDLPGLLQSWHKFDKAFRAWDRSVSGQTDSRRTVKETDRERAIQATKAARKEIEKILYAVDEDVVSSR
ncbi:MAG: hypothetical protein IK077_16060 [Thermoguttaceae bacterium]|nr:hypothetical protein [Thermoguttaceae bacterium]